MYAYKREVSTQKALEKRGVRSFIPMRYEIKICKGKKERILVPAVSCLIFVYSTASILKDFKAKNPHLQYVMQKRSDCREKIVIPESQMNDFINVSEKYKEDLIYYKPEEINLKKGTRVRVHGGAFDGLEGTLLKVKGKRDKRIVVKIPGLVAVVGSAALGAVSEDPKILGKTLIFVGLAEGVAIYGLVISIMIIGSL